MIGEQIELAPAQIVMWLVRVRTRQAELQAAQTSWQQQIADFNWCSGSPVVIYQNALKDVDRGLTETTAVLAWLEGIAEDAVARGLLNQSDLS